MKFDASDWFASSSWTRRGGRWNKWMAVVVGGLDFRRGESSISDCAKSRWLIPRYPSHSNCKMGHICHGGGDKNGSHGLCSAPIWLTTTMGSLIGKVPQRSREAKNQDPGRALYESRQVCKQTHAVCKFYFHTHQTKLHIRYRNQTLISL